MDDFPDRSLREYVPRHLIASIAAMLGFDYMRVFEVQILPDVVTVRHMDDEDNITNTEIRIRR